MNRSTLIVNAKLEKENFSVNKQFVKEILIILHDVNYLQKTKYI